MNDELITVKKSSLESLADTIREVSETTDEMVFPTEWDSTLRNIPKGIFPNGTKIILENGAYDVKEFANVSVEVDPPAGSIVPSGDSPPIRSNGTFNVREYENAVVDVPIPNGYVLPTETVNITQNNISNQDITMGKFLNVNVPVKHFATGVIDSVSAGQQISVTGITDSITEETFNIRGVILFICPTSATNFKTSGEKPAAACIYRDLDMSEAAAICAYNSAYSIRIHSTTPNTYLSVSGNSFTYQSLTASMYGVMAARWRWFAWG